MLTTLIKKNNRKRKIYKWIKILLSIYTIIGIAAYFLQDKIILEPLKVEKNYDYAFGFPSKDVNIAYDKNTNINIVQFTPNDSAKGVILYFHGNRNNIYRYRRFVPNFTKWGYEVWMIDYPGFGKSTGVFTEQLAYDWSLIMYQMARKRFPPGKIIIYGKSLGTGIAAQLASIRDCKKLILETPYYSMSSLAKHYLWLYPVDLILKYKLPTNQYLTKVTAPVIVFHGTNDYLIPYSNAVQLKDALKKGDEFITIKGGNHRNLNEYTLMKEKLDSLLKY